MNYFNVYRVRPVQGVLIVTLFLVFCFLPDGAFSQAESVSTLVSKALNKGDAHELSKSFNSMVDITIPGVNNTFGKIQAERVLSDFFRKNPVKSYKSEKTGNSNDGSFYTIGMLNAGTKSYHVYFLLKENSGSSLLHQLQISEIN